ncbi:hypothetical protein PV10_07471 [Exophiala mesophila]|uniref:Enoyl reductase (ER) domain-containing protein n=1 Tax=Exophiala mesophila TaxID=212818 RepID=A0A0D1WMA5_EXOME|nr:uncharacterized protein PV10_07471 [Exophiala mesophila]KIV90130.1 hypothetical protein PV10_07471 [Exophiala mesophila]
MVPKVQKAIVITEIGKPVTLVTDRPVPQPGQNQIQVQVTVTATNPHDQKLRDFGLLVGDHLPALFTNDVVGKVVAVGSEVTKFAVGDRVVSFAALDTTNYSQVGSQEYVVFDQDISMKIPDQITDDDAATLPVNLIAVFLGFFDEPTLNLPAPWTKEAAEFDYKNTTVLIVGGGSNCGRFAVQLAALAGFGRIVVVGGNEAELKGWGATNVLDRQGTPDEVLKRIHGVVGDELLYAIDCVNDLDGQALGVNALSSSKKGKFTRLVPHGPVNEALIKPKKAGCEITAVFGAMRAQTKLVQEFWSRLPQYLLDGKVVPLAYTVVQGFTPDKVNAVLDAYRDGKKVVQAHFHVI